VVGPTIQSGRSDDAGLGFTHDDLQYGFGLERLTSIGVVSAKRFEVRLKFLLGHRYIIEREEFLLAVSTDESAGINPVKFVGEGISSRLMAMRARQHFRLSQCSVVRIILCKKQSGVLTMYQLLASQNLVCSVLNTSVLK
jgi:hypothetical protein